MEKYKEKKSPIKIAIKKLKRVFFGKKSLFDSSKSYWERRYHSGGNSGSGSYNRLAEFKAEVLNDFVKEKNIRTVIELGCGDGAQLELSSYPNYVGIDVSPTAVSICKEKFAKDHTKSFFILNNFDFTNKFYDLALSLDVIYHLVEDETFDQYMKNLFSVSKKYVVIYSSNEEKAWPAPHVRHRQFTQWVMDNQPAWEMIGHINNRYPFDENDQENTSFADFYIYGRKNIS
ncbi:class I SAM-dependent methyltransferase [Telmatospirillum sp. J64-1]|uniref:class I SAM-dependent methyltransferase n=1 Tax=Telmatospirillum sp. J64-1 TaxID=2502183 RepID=UPI00115E99D0|nr:class I SAM-dependent methyltransferase [Telmatospirillum sp. J64-1]